jgi:hypothetical protein
LERYRILRIYRLSLFSEKQRRVKKKSELIIPVSCTEQGRWSYQTDEFSNSENILSYKIRGKKAAFVSDFLKQGWDYRFEGKDKVGSALVYRKGIIHMAFFKISKEERAGRMSGCKRRRGYRI